MKTNLLKVMSLMLILTMVLSACASKDNDNSSADTTQDPNKPVELTVFSPQTVGIENLDVNKFSRYLEEKLNIKFNWSTSPEAAFNDKKLLLLASGDYPSVILSAGMSKADQVKYGQQGAFIPLNDLIEQYAPNIKKAMTDLPYLKDGMVAPDGNIYALPKINECLHCTYYQRLWINTEWLEKLDLAMPTTTEEFYQVMKAFKEKDPNGNGKNDEIPFTTSNNDWGGGVETFLMNAFIYNDGTGLMIKDGQVIYAPMQPEWKEGVKYLHKLFQEGLMDKAAFTQNVDAVKQLANKPDVVVGSVGTANIGGIFEVNDNNNTRHKAYDVVPPLKGPDGVQLAGYTVGAGAGQFVITNKATKEEQIAAIRLADYLFSEEGTVLTTWGFEGEGYKMAESGELDYNGNPAKYNVVTREQSASGQNPLANTWWQLGTMQMLNSIRESFVAPADPLEKGAIDYRLWLAAKKYEPFAKPEMVYPTDVFIDPADALIVTQMSKTLSDYVKSNLAQFVTGNKDIDKDWDNYVNGFKGMQLDAYLAAYQKALDK
ncbi:ABC transporter substrate-binding protein [Paenibacillus sp. Marseille-Q4541]|uniref:ABC transporter substrate-binding protein n=1 Tax=Paenibacillus sp. Marseille-Q4541 TaxID=2831522 RepID=UPI001BABE3D4|nr:ABC transporter substrate-binding protein [Paenibacillus sp. Marseille-Q4541]